MARLIDISQVLRADLPVWPGEPALALTRHATISEQCPVNVGALSTPLHAGTHADAPMHYDPAGLSAAQCALQPYFGPCVVIDVTAAGAVVMPGDVDWPALAGAQRVLFRTYARFPADVWDSAFKAISPPLIERLAAMGVCLIGTDAASLDPEQSKTLDAHHLVQAADMRILEGLVLDGVVPGRYHLIAFPLRILGADASPVRAVLWDNDTDA